jgi:hypothetical protein
MRDDDDALHAWFIFNLHTKFHLYLHDTQSIVNQKPLCEKEGKERKPRLTWKSDVLLMVANPHPLWSLVWKQLPTP